MRAHCRIAAQGASRPETIRPRKGFNTRDALPVLGIGEALVSVIGEDNVPSEVKVKVGLPVGQIGPALSFERGVAMETSHCA